MTKEEQLAIAKNARVIRELIKDVKPESVVLEMCQDRYEHWFYDAISHPNYDRTLTDIHKILDSGKPEQLLEFKGLDLEKQSTHLELLVGLDVCSYRMMPCKTIFGDRSIKITNKRYKSKVKMLEVYKQALEENKGEEHQEVKSTSTIFDLDAAKDADSDTSDQILRLRNALRSISPNSV